MNIKANNLDYFYFYYAYDGEGNVVEVYNQKGSLPYGLYSYSAYGSAEKYDGDDVLDGGYKGYDNGPFGYKTGVRHYDPETGRFLSPDPFKGYLTDPPSQNPYMYTHGNPIKYSDPSGYYTALQIGGLIAYGVSVSYLTGKAFRLAAKRRGVPRQEIEEALEMIRRTHHLKKNEKPPFYLKAKKVMYYYKKIYPTHTDIFCGKAKLHLFKDLSSAFAYDKDIHFYMQRRGKYHNFNVVVVRIENMEGEIVLYGGSDIVINHKKQGTKTVEYDEVQKDLPMD